jgi:hypothetical protein
MNLRHPLRERGQELMEYAITLPIFLLLAFGIFDLGRGVYYYNPAERRLGRPARGGQRLR